MKDILYESPCVEVFNLEFEGVLCNSGYDDTDMIPGIGNM